MMLGVKVARVRFRRVCGTAGTRSRDAKGRNQVKKSKVASTDARREGVSIYSSDEVSVMGKERRNRVVLVNVLANSLLRMNQ